MATITMTPSCYSELWRHLLPDNSKREQAAFMFAKVEAVPSGLLFAVKATQLLGSDDFLVHRGDHIELADACRRSVIKEAHDRNAALIEIHSHPIPWPAQLSYADFLGLRDTVPHMLWRLPARPYVALVAAPTGFDGLLWNDEFESPSILSAMQVGGMAIEPTNLSMELWK